MIEFDNPVLMAPFPVENVIPWVSVRQWVFSFPIPLRFLLASHPNRLSPVLHVINRAISTFLIQPTGLKRTEAQTCSCVGNGGLSRFLDERNVT